VKIYVAISALYSGADRLTWRCLAAQTDLDFTVVLMDLGNDPELRERAEFFSKQTGVQVIHVPYRHPPGSRMFDWGMWSSSFLFAENENDFVLRLQSWRLISSNCIAYLRQLGGTTGFQRYQIMRGPEFVDEFINTPVQPVHEQDSVSFGLYACYGDWFMRVGDYLELNGIDEPLTTLFHFEDLDFECRWRIGVRKNLVIPGFTSRGQLVYLNHDMRRSIQEKYSFKASTEKADVTYRKPCPRCQGQWPELQAINDPQVALDSIRNNGGMVDLGRQFGKRWFYCRLCDAPVCHVGSPHFTTLTYSENEHRATIGLMKRWGRNLRLAREKALKLPLESRIKYVSESYGDQEVLKL
jgi:hypothetical protein